MASNREQSAAEGRKGKGKDSGEKRSRGRRWRNVTMGGERHPLGGGEVTITKCPQFPHRKKGENCTHIKKGKNNKKKRRMESLLISGEFLGNTFSTGKSVM